MWGRGAVERVVQGHLPPERRAVVELVLHVQVCPYDVYVRMPVCMQHTRTHGYCGIAALIAAAELQRARCILLLLPCYTTCLMLAI